MPTNPLSFITGFHGRLTLRYIRCAALCLTPFSILAQTTATIDGYLNQLKTATSDSARAAINCEIGRHYQLESPVTAMGYYQTAWAWADKSKQYAVAAECGRAIGGLYQFQLADLTKSVTWYGKSLQSAQLGGDSSIQADVYTRLGRILLLQGDTSGARKYYEKSIELSPVRQASLLHSVANLRLAEIAPDPLTRFAYLQRAIRQAQQNPDNHYLLPNAWRRMGDYYWRRGQFSEARTWYEKVVAYGYVPDQKDAPARQLALAVAYWRIDSLQAAEITARRVIENTQKAPLTYADELIEAHRVGAEVAHQKGENALAYAISSRLLHLSDSIAALRTSLTAQQAILRLRAEYELDQRQKDLELLQSKSQLQTIQVFALSVSLVLLGAFAFYFYQTKRREVAQNESLARLNQTKDKILSILSHDVRSPLKAMQNILHLFEVNIVGREDLGTVTRQVSATINNLYKNLDNLLIWAQGQQHELKAQPELISVKKVMSDYIETLSHWSADKQLALQVDLPDTLTVFADPMHLRLIVQNILTNAYKFSPPQSAIYITGHSDREGMTHLVITDEGSGIQPEAIAKIFDPSVHYTRPGTLSEPGSGLGLTLTNDLLRLNGGRLELQSSARGRGATAIVLLPSKSG